MSVKVPKSQLWKAIREHCLECSGDSFRERELCTVKNCNLWPYRFGHACKSSQTGDAIDGKRPASGGEGRVRCPNFLERHGYGKKKQA